MGKFLDTILGTNAENSQHQQAIGAEKYKNATLVEGKDASVGNNSGCVIQTIQLKGNRDTLAAKDELRAGNIVIIDLSGITGQSGNIRVERVINELYNVIEDIDGDLAYLDEDQTHVILTPNTVGISREKL